MIISGIMDLLNADADEVEIEGKGNYLTDLARRTISEGSGAVN